MKNNAPDTRLNLALDKITKSQNWIERDNMAPKRKRSDSVKSSSGKRRRSAVATHPMTIVSSNRSHNLKIRFLVDPGNNYSITANNIADLICFPLGSSYPYRLTDRFRIKKVEMWAPPDSGGGPVTMGFQWVGNTQAAADNQYWITDTSLGQDRPAHIVTKPPKAGTHSLWQIASAAIVMQFTCPTGTVIDLTLDVTWQDVFSAATQCSTVQATGAANQMCCKALDGLSYILPVGWVVA